MTASIKKKRLRKMDTLEDFPKRLGSIESRGALFVVVNYNQRRKQVFGWWREVRELGRVGRSTGMSVSLLPARLVSPPIIMHVISQWAGNVSRTRKVCPFVQSEKEYQCECTWTFFHFSLDQYGLREDASCQSYSCEHIQTSQVLGACIHHIHPLLLLSFSQLTYG